MLKLALNHKHGMSPLSFLQGRQGARASGPGLYKEGDLEGAKDLGVSRVKTQAKRLVAAQSKGKDICVYVYLHLVRERKKKKKQDVHACIRACVRACACVCECVGMYICMYVCMYVRTYVGMYGCGLSLCHWDRKQAWRDGNAKKKSLR